MFTGTCLPVLAYVVHVYRYNQVSQLRSHPPIRAVASCVASPRECHALVSVQRLSGRFLFPPSRTRTVYSEQISGTQSSAPRACLIKHPFKSADAKKDMRCISFGGISRNCRVV